MTPLVVTLRFLELLALVVWVGGIAFFSFIASPSVFGVLGLESGGKVIRAIFDKYYVLGYACGGLGTFAAATLAYTGHGHPLITFLFVGMTLVVLCMGLVLRPLVLRARAPIGGLEAPDADPKSVRAFERLHRLSVSLNVLLLGLGLLLVFSLALVSAGP